MRETVDMFTGRPVTRPNPFVAERYEFDFTCDGEWVYLNSFAHPSDEELQRQKHLVSDAGEQWRVVDAWSGVTLEESGETTISSYVEALLTSVAARCRHLTRRLL